ncbi:Uncharacterised protein [Segatella copri]|nr:Uncharacterised protein [Segatella copri]
MTCNPKQTTFILVISTGMQISSMSVFIISHDTIQQISYNL